MGAKRVHAAIFPSDSIRMGKAYASTPASFWRPVALALGAFILIDKLGPVLQGRAGAISRSTGVLWDEPPRLLSQDDHNSTGGGNLSSSHESSHGEGHGEGHGAGHSDEHAHPHEALFFLILTILIGTLIMQLSTFPVFKGMQTTVVLFVLGVILSLLMKGMEFQEQAGAIGRSYEMWMKIDSHLLLFTLLPPLLAGDAMNIDIAIAKKVSKQCLYLAGPGVLINTFLFALFLYYYLPYQWDFLLCLSTGAILSATDPVAVVALLKELGASPTLTVQIQGESLLNDGTAIVLFNVAYDMLQGMEYEPGDIVSYLVKMAIYAWMLGVILGGLFWAWIRAAKSMLNDTSSTIQVLLTIACAYCSFIVAEGIFHISGVLCTVAASLFMASKLWPEVVCHETMHTIWHMLENIGNTIIFFLAGSLTGSIMLRIELVDYGHLLLLYVVLIVLRFSLFILSRPILQYLADDQRPIPLADAVVMSWGGLRGAVGLALGIKVSVERAGGALSEENADRVLFYVGGVAFLTLVINALTCPALVKWLEITKTSETKQRLMLMIHQQLVDEVEEAQEIACVQKNLNVLLEDLKCSIMPKGGLIHASSLHPDLNLQAGSFTATLGKTLDKVRQSIIGPPQACLSGCEDVLEGFEREKSRYEQAPKEVRVQVKAMMPHNHTWDHVDTMSEMLRNQKIDKRMVRGVNEAFLSLVRAAYWHQVEHNEIHVCEFDTLAESVSTALSTACDEINDFKALKRKVEIEEDESFFRPLKPLTSVDLSTRKSRVSGRVSTTGQAAKEPPSCIERVCESMGYRMMKFLAIIANTVFIIMEDYFPPDPGTSQEAAFLAVEGAFLFVFTTEFILEFAYIRCRFFRDAWCLFDFALVVVGWVGISLRIVLWGDAVEDGSLAQTARFLKYFRAVRMMRLIKGFERVVGSVRANIGAVETAKHIRKYSIFAAFIRAHCHAQHELLRFLGRHHEPDSPELARCLMQSLTDIYKAMSMCAFELMAVDEWMIQEKHACQESIEAAVKMQKLVADARQGGVISSSEAEALFQYMEHYWSQMEHRIEDVRNGIATEPTLVGETEEDEPDEEEPTDLASTQCNAAGMGSRGLVHLAAEAVRKSVLSDAETEYLRSSELASPTTTGTPPAEAEGKAATPPEPAEEPPAARRPSKAARAGKEKRPKKEAAVEEPSKGRNVSFNVVTKFSME